MAGKDANSPIKTLKDAQHAARGLKGDLIVVDANGCVYVNSDPAYLASKKEKLFVVKGKLPEPKPKVKNEQDATQ